MKPGKMDRRVSFQRYQETGRNDFNEPIMQWTALADAWASKLDVSDVEKVNAGHEQSALVSRFVIRWNPTTKTITAADRMSFDGKTWNIQGVKETAQGRNHFIEVTAVRVSD